MKRKVWNRILSVFIAAALMVSAIPINAFAEGQEILVEEVGVTPATTEEVQQEETSGDEENQFESSNVEVQEVEENKEETAETTEATEATEATEEMGSVTEETTVQFEEESQATESSSEATEAMGVESVEILLYSVDNLNSLDALVTLAGKTDKASVSVDESTKKITVDVGGLILLSNADVDFSGYTIYLSTLSGGYADLTKTITIEETSTDENGAQTTTSKVYSFQGLGSETKPFSGTLESQDGSYGVILNVPFFRNVDVSKKTFTNFSTLKMKQKRNTTSAMLAANVSGSSGENWKSLKIEVGKESVTDGGTTTDYLPAALIGTMAGNASLSLRTVTYNDGAAVSSENAGLLCNTMGAGSSLSVDSLTVGGAVTVTATNGSAGGLVGLMNSGASLTVNAGADTASVTIGLNFTITGQNAGGLIGSGENVKLNVKTTIAGATVKGNTAAGGLIGSYTTGAVEGGFASYDGADTSTLRVNNVALNTTSDSAYAGGLFGALELKSDFSISNASVTSSITGSKAYYGGLVGQVKGDSADSLKALTISGTSNPNTTTTVNLQGYAGAVAAVGGTTDTSTKPVYVKITGTFTSTFVGANILAEGTYFGGIAAYLKEKSVLELTANVTIVCEKIAEKKGYGGGVLGNAERGSTLCLGGITNLSGTKFYADYINEYTGQIVGTQESALIYAKSDWKLIRQSTEQELDDIGTYGSVIRLGGNMGMGRPSGEPTGLSANLISQDATTHKTVFSESAKTTLTDNTFTITSADQLALLAIEEQTKCAFQIYGTSEDYYLKLNPNITLGADISLAHTGITGLQRDNGACTEYGGTLDGQSNTLTVAVGEIYGYRSADDTKAKDSEAGSGQIHGHTQVGFFSHANATVKNLNVDGDMYLRFRTTDTSTTYLAGGLVATNTAASTYTNVTTSVNIQYQGTTSGSIGGLVGYGSALTFTNCTGSAAINAGNSAVYAGGLIGQYTGSTLAVSNTTLSGTMTANEANHARLGGLVSRIANVSYRKYNEVNVSLTGITVDGQSITGTGIKGSTVNNVTIPASCGGLLGYEWNNASVTFGNKSTHTNGLTVTGNSSVTVDRSTETAGLVYAATGYWQVNDIKLQNLSVTSGSGDLGLLICRGWRKDIPANSSTPTKPYLLYVEETKNNAYQIGNVSVSNTGGCFDEWVAYTCEKKEYITNNGNSVISIATEAGTLVENQRVGVDPTDANCTSYQNRTEYGKTAQANLNARYYYDLDVIRAAAQQNNLVNTPGEMVLWAVWRYAEKTGGEVSNIASYFSTSDIRGASMNGDGTLIDLTGYAYYPITVDGFNLFITNMNVKFANQEIEAAESKTETPLDSLNRTTVGTTESHTQHYLLHSGLLLNYQNSSSGSDVTMTVSNVTFQGTIGKGPNDGSGALICGQLGGYTHATSPKYAKLNIYGEKLKNGVTLNGVTADVTDGYAPLLVNRVGGYSSLSAQKVTTSGYTDVTSTNNPAATSLIGHVGGKNATNITLAFSNNIALNGKKENSIFSHATLLESFQYQSGGSGYYRFYEGDTFTYGREISESVENKDSQKWYSRKNPTDPYVEVKDGENTDFSKDYLPYVCKPYTDGTDKYHELEVNLASPDLTEGCGTYDDPYIISSPGQLMRVADFINGNSPQTGWKVNKVDNAAIIKTDTEDNHTTFEVGTSDWNDAAMRTYMRGAYYQIKEDFSGDLTLKSFAGFGTVNNPFVGAFDGNGKTIIIENAGSGFINVSYGSVVRNLTIQYTGSKTFTDKRPAGVTGDNSKEVYEDSYFGGIIGTIMGGDSLIDNVTVEMNGFTIETKYKLQCAGGFVGLIQGGGVVFRNMSSQSGYTGTNSTYYVDKYIGRVLDGYAINEVTGSATNASVTFAAGTNIDGTGKNYSIPDISSSGTIAWNNGNISIGNAQQMMILTDIINSGAASGGSAKAYSSGAKTRNANYSLIGKIGAEGFNTAFSTSRKDDTTLGAENYPYLITKYAGNADGFWTVCTTGTLSLVFSPDSTKIDLSTYGNGYRGIGGRYYCNANGGTLTNNTPKITSVTGNGVSLHVSNDIKEYRADNFYANAVGGLFNVLRHEGANIENVNVYGTVKVRSDFGTIDDAEADYLKRAPVGGVIGRDDSTTETVLTLTKVSFGKENTVSTVYGECVTGGLIGSSGSKMSTVFGRASANKTTLSMANCSYQNVTITGGICTGGFVGAAVWNSDEYALFGESNKPNNTMEVTWTDSQIVGGKNATISNLFCAEGGNIADGVGGIIGFCSIPFIIQGVNSQMTTFDTIELYGGDGNMRGRIGGLIGFIVNDVNSGLSRSIASIKLTNMTVGAAVTRYPSSYDDNAGIIVGTWYAKGEMKICDCVVEKSSVQANSSGGILGYGGNGGNIVAKNVQMTDITLPKRGGANIGAVGGQISISFYGQNILLKNLTFSNTTYAGRFFGTGTNARLLGVTIQQNGNNTLPKYENYYKTYPTDYGTTNYVVYAGYNSNSVSSTITTASDIATLPSQVIPGIAGGLHGDTVKPDTVTKAVKDSDTYYQNLSAAGIDKTKFAVVKSTYNEHQDITKRLEEDDNFPVVLIDGDASVLKQYLNAATNGGFDSLRKYQSNNTSGGKVVVTTDRYLYNKDLKTFSKTDKITYPDTLVYHESTGEFTTTAQYDNQKGTFTLVTVTMTGYDESDTFVLHIPVIVRRMLQVDFMATMTSGTVFNKTDTFYNETKNHALASNGENITGYLTFHYNSNTSDPDNPASYDWQSYMEGGGDLLGYYKKTVDTGKNPLPAGTKITLIDCQNDDRRYYAQVGEGKTSQLELFNGGNLTFTASNGNSFTPATLSDLLEISATPATEEQKSDATVVKWVKLGNEIGATVKAMDGNYYRLYDAITDKDVKDLYTLTVGNSSPTENYFVVISVPNAENYRLTLDKAGMDWSKSTTKPPLEVHQVHRYDRTSAETKEGISEASFNYLNNYQQTLNDNTEAENVKVQTTGAKVDIPVSVTNTVTFNLENYKDYDPLYQKLVISLKKIEEGSTTTVGIPSDAVAVTNTDSGTATKNAVKLYAYYGDESNRHYYVWNNGAWEDHGTEKVPAVSYAWSASADSSEMVLPFAVKTKIGYQYIDLAALRKASGGKFFLEAETTLEMSMASVMTNNTIPYDAANGGTIENFTQIDAASILSFTESGLSYSTLKGNVAGNKKYYLNTERKAILKLDYTNIDQLGINLLEDHTAAIDTVLTLDFSNMEGFVSDVTQFKTLSEADKVVFTISLQKKGDSGYTDASIGDYLLGARTSDGNSLSGYTITISKNGDGSYTYYNEQTGQFNIPISFSVKTEVREFANYRIRASVTLLKEGQNQNLDVDVTNAFITYTYAKINVDGYWD